jgi:hypothetical protein
MEPSTADEAFSGFEEFEDNDAPADFGGDRDRERSSAAKDFGEFDGFDDEGDGEAGLIGGKSGGGTGQGRSQGPFAPAPSAPKKKASDSKSSKPKPKPQSQPKPNWEDEMFGPGGGEQGWGGGGAKGGSNQWLEPDQNRWRPRMSVRRTSGPSRSELDAIAALRATRDADPSDRKAHRKLVARAIRDGHPDTASFTAAWAVADPDHAPALLAHADQLAAAGDPLALRAYASAIEVEPFSVTMHRRMAQALESAGDFERSCSHRRALVSIDPADAKATTDLVECLVASGRELEAHAALTRAAASVSSKAGKQALAKVEKVFSRGVTPRKQIVHSSPDLRAELRWTADENLDVAFVDKRGRRLSVLRPQGVLVREERDGAQRLEILTMRKVSGRVFVEVTRPTSNSEDSVRATLLIKTATGRQQFVLELEPGTQRVALVRWD